MQRLSRLYKGIVVILGFAAGISFAALAVFITIDVIIRNLGISNFPWLLEVSEYVLFAATFLAAPWVLHENAHVRVDFLITNLPAGAARPIAVVAELLGIGISAALTYYALRLTLEAIARGDLIFKELVVPEWPFFAIVVFSGSLLVTEFCRRAFMSARLTGLED